MVDKLHGNMVLTLLSQFHAIAEMLFPNLKSQYDFARVSTQSHETVHVWAVKR
jgi:hypothetical protein